MADCLICKTPIKPFISFGKMPIANGFLSKEQFKTEFFYELGACLCDKCGMVD